jgi:hypothetical protein
MQQGSPKRWYLPTPVQGVTSQKTKKTNIAMRLVSVTQKMAQSSTPVEFMYLPNVFSLLC